jgi:hypothetical protein
LWFETQFWNPPALMLALTLMPEMFFAMIFMMFSCFRAVDVQRPTLSAAVLGHCSSDATEELHRSFLCRPGAERRN